ncbi:LuxR C-terminal-related transcriptional regulator [Muricoccus aerilatus]|uniref:LuxR C-terminal-related transcriptional regulator n=1 Tax=Muricoccus aerilatus TaxID=452982 RepID=UPI0006937D9A|nr:LuxR C-terminal-related transcriptional regulator [Roseomonas aerilata]
MGGRPPGPAIQAAITADAAGLQERRRLAAVRQADNDLSAREREVMSLMVDGLMNKQIAGWLDVSEPTVKGNRF